LRWPNRGYQNHLCPILPYLVQATLNQGKWGEGISQEEAPIQAECIHGHRLRLVLPAGEEFQLSIPIRSKQVYLWVPNGL
jgi:hypothetical protein